MSIEPEDFDQTVISFRNQIGFDHAALDLVDDGGTRSSVRNGFSYYSGFPSETIPSRVPTGERRRFVILNNQPGASQFEVLYISADYSSSQATTIRSIIDSVEASTGSEPDEVVLTTQVSPPSAGVVTGGGFVTSGEEVALAATPMPGYRFFQWQGNVTNSATANTTIVPTSDVTVTALFIRQWELLVDSQPGGSASGGGTFDSGTMASITATPDEGYRFAEWIGEGIADPSQPTTSVTLDESRTVSATFVQVWNLGVSASAGGTAEGGGIFDAGVTVPIRARPDEGYRFGGWLGDGIADATAPETTAVVNADAMVTAMFVKVWSLNVEAGEGGQVEGSGVIDAGETITIVATADDGYRFAGWTGEGIDNLSVPETTITVNSDTTVMASFVRVWDLAVTAGMGGAASSGGTFDEGSSAPIMAIAEEGYRFGSWVGDGVTDLNAAETTVTINSGVAAMANFVKVWSLEVIAGEGGSVEGAGSFDDQAVVPITALPNEGYRFAGWSGEGIADNAALETAVTVATDSTATASFVKVWTLEVTAGEGGTVEGAGTFDNGAEATITAFANEGFEFVRWEGSDAIADAAFAQTSVTVAEALNLTAVFMATEVEPMPDTDSDGDGLPDVWEETNGLDSTNPGDAREDADNDLFTNVAEYSARTDPQDPQSHLRIVRVVNEASGLTLEWRSVPGVNYQIEATADLSAGWVTVATSLAETTVSEIAMLNRELGPYFRVRVARTASN